MPLPKEVADRLSELVKNDLEGVRASVEYLLSNKVSPQAITDFFNHIEPTFISGKKMSEDKLIQQASQGELGRSPSNIKLIMLEGMIEEVVDIYEFSQGVSAEQHLVGELSPQEVNTFFFGLLKQAATEISVQAMDSAEVVK
jgi:hypothetical protein